MPTEWNLVAGSLFSSVVRKKKSDQFTVVTSTSVLGVRGTKFLAEEKEKETYVCVCDGSVGVRLKGGSVPPQRPDFAENPCGGIISALL